ncbi:hypothetical protein Ddye_010118 [Dipteronia dyeriana]|uniref:GATA-type domain-containing protein n=1 Tax=Dipteronia dyeriana TaxID=168575 RepID=A0AAD9XD93_9ROSI|nr:hypothetical protein Ddye_010118 [Dipteronia dyeriana]
MLYQTHHPQYFFLQILSFTSSVPPLSLSPLKISPLSSSSSSSFSSPLQRMESGSRAGFRNEMAVKSSPVVGVSGDDDMWTTNSQKGVLVDEFSVDDLLDFSNEDGLIEQTEQTHEAEHKNQGDFSVTVTVTTAPKQEQQQEIFNFDDLGPIPVGELAVPVDDVANLEWLSHFVEDSFSEYSTPFPAGTVSVKTKDKGSEPEKLAVKTEACFRSPVPAKARSKRSRSGGRVWSLGSPPSLTDSSSGSTSPGSSSPSSPLLIYTNHHPGSVCIEPAERFSWERKPPAKRQKKKVAGEVIGDGDRGSSGGGGGATTKFERRCSHCAVHKTPQWRTGPYGPKTLCNACGVRYKSGRLFPEYRPACSPTFSSERHSNHHRKVLEMRRQKETLGQTEPGLVPQVVPSF